MAAREARRLTLAQVNTVLTRHAFHTVSVDGTSLRDWVAALADGRTVNDVGTRLLGGR